MTNHPNRSKKKKTLTPRQKEQAELMEKLARAFNEWQRRFVANPADFLTEDAVLGTFIRDLNNGRVPSHGERQAAYLMLLMGELK